MIPAVIALTIAAIGRMTAIKGPSSAYDTDIESTPVSGVDTKNDIVADGEAPERRSPSAAGMTPQEQSGSGAPMTAALLTDAMLSWDICRSNNVTGIRCFIIPATANPNSSQGADSVNKSIKFNINSFTRFLRHLNHHIPKQSISNSGLRFLWLVA